MQTSDKNKKDNKHIINDSIKRKARSELQKKALNKDSKNDNNPLSKKKEDSNFSKDINKKEVIVPKRKEVRGIPSAKLDVFTKSSSFEIPLKENKSRVGNHEYWKQGELDFKEKNTEERNVSSSIIKKTNKVQEEGKPKEISKVITNKEKQNVEIKNLKKETVKSKKTKSQSKNNNNTKKAPLKKKVNPSLKAKAKSKRTNKTKKNLKNKQKSNNKNKFTIILITFIVLLIFFIGKLIYDKDVFNSFFNNSASNEIKNTNIIEPKKIDDIENNFFYVGDNLQDLSPLSDSVNDNIENIEDGLIINIEDEKLSGDYIKLKIEKGLSATAIANLLEDNNVCKKDDFLQYVVEHDLESNLRSGLYVIKKNSNIEEIVNSIVESDSTLIKIYPASTINQIDQLLTNRKLISSGEFIEACTNICREKGLNFVEGWFTPATYKITNKFDVNLLAETMLNNTFITLSPYLKDISKSGFSIEDIIIIASLIQAETQDVNQMPIISSVIHNRIKLDMPLGIDATTRYELGNWSSELTQEQLDKQTPYNTRRKKGLPPSGICLSSKNAIVSAIYPIDSDYLYYIHDKDGSLITAKTYEQHLENIDKRDKK